MRKVGFTVEEERALCAKAQSGDAAALAELMSGFDPLLRTLASKYSRGCGAMDDNLQSARIGAIQAVKSFDPERGKRLCTFIYRCAINQICRSMDQFLTIRLPSNILHGIGKLDAAIERLEAKYGRAPAIEEVAAELKVSDNVASSLMRLPRHQVSLDAPMVSVNHFPDPDAQIDYIPDDSPAPDEALIQKEASQFLLAAIDSLPNPDSEIIKRRFGLSPFSYSQSFNEIGAELQMVSQKVYRIEKRALRTLKDKLKNIIGDGARDFHNDERCERILNLKSLGLCNHEIASELDVSAEYVFQVLREAARRGSCSRGV